MEVMDREEAVVWMNYELWAGLRIESQTCHKSMVYDYILMCA